MNDFALDVENLAVKHRAQAAFRSLMTAGPEAALFVRLGLRHSNPSVVVACCNVLDHFLFEDAVPDLIGLLEHTNDDVRARAMHALACDRCKEGACRPGEDESVPLALSMLHSDPSALVRAAAVDLVGRSVHGRPDVAAALEHARDNDPSPNVRKQAGLRAPGGVLYLRTSPVKAERWAARKHLKPTRLRS
jgi:HEAT repeat protein